MKHAGGVIGTAMRCMNSSNSMQTTFSRCLLLLLGTLLVIVEVARVTRRNLTIPADDTSSHWVESPEVVEYEANLPQDNKGKRLLENEGRSKKPASNNQYAEVITNAQRSAIALLDTKTGWTKNRGDSLDGKGLVYTQTVGRDTVFKMEANLKSGVHTLYENLVNKPEEASKWNTNVLERGVLERVDNSSDLIYSLSRGRFIASKDYVFVRHWEVNDNWYIINTVSVRDPSKRKNLNYVQAKQKPEVITVIRMKEIGPKKLRFEWFLRLDLKLPIPMIFLKSFFIESMITYLKDLRAHAATLLTPT
ncbi:steroidogenic acute regulatory protein, mitochondrial-like [Watersipora subatra]|uniref:steroidogenic acute regulatory protein, mitochondrial-like n=1 Tax=Watersipora subatra TaxID=2589382 RepID=UPI00355BB67F